MTGLATLQPVASLSHPSLVVGALFSNDRLAVNGAKSKVVQGAESPAHYLWPAQVVNHRFELALLFHGRVSTVVEESATLAAVQRNGSYLQRVATAAFQRIIECSTPGHLKFLVHFTRTWTCRIQRPVPVRKAASLRLSIAWLSSVCATRRQRRKARS